MTAEQKIYAILSADAGVTALVAASKVKPYGDWQSMTPPYIVHFPVDGETTQCHDGPKALRMWTYYQVSVFASSHGAARAIAAAVEAALDNYSDSDVNLISMQHPPIPTDYDTDLKVAHIAMSFFVAGALA